MLQPHHLLNKTLDSNQGFVEIPEGADIMLTFFQIPDSWYNITSRNNNKSIGLQVQVHILHTL
jgi:hypothetical protein